MHVHYFPSLKFIQNYLPKGTIAHGEIISMGELLPLGKLPPWRTHIAKGKLLA
jgi:hypothetical protein